MLLIRIIFFCRPTHPAVGVESPGETDRFVLVKEVEGIG
jgi:hypothetical protein